MTDAQAKVVLAALAEYEAEHEVAGLDTYDPRAVRTANNAAANVAKGLRNA
jgi:hypothetical protein